MTDVEAAQLILNRWLDGAESFNPQALMMQLICLGKPVHRSDVLAVVRAYVDHQSENTHLYEAPMACKPKPGKPKPKDAGK